MLGEIETSTMVEVPLTFTFTYDCESEIGRNLDAMSEEDRTAFAQGYIATRMAAMVDTCNEHMEDYIIGLRPVEGM